MRIIKLDATDSTNSFLRQLSTSEVLTDFTIVVANNQTSGRGQMGAVWESESGKNLTASVFVDVSFLKLESHFFISIITSLALIKTLNQFSIPNLKIKWPNDILSENKKIGGVLIENVVKQNALQSSIIGLGLNVNQINFQDLPKASSLKAITGAHYNLDESLIALMANLKVILNELKQKEFSKIKDTYESLLFRKDKPSTFQDSEFNKFPGFIKSVSNSGKLQVLLEDNELREFDLKEITLLY